jgi:hypothetical protein
MPVSVHQMHDVICDRLHVPDSDALELIGFSGKIGALGKRPRFRFWLRRAPTKATVEGECEGPTEMLPFPTGLR